MYPLRESLPQLVSKASSGSFENPFVLCSKGASFIAHFLCTLASSAEQGQFLVGLQGLPVNIPGSRGDACLPTRNIERSEPGS